MTNYRIIFTLLCCLSFIGCGDGDDEPSGGPKPALSMTIASSGANSVTLNMKRTNATSVKIIYKATGVITSETAQSVAQNGTQYTGTTVEIDGLAAQTTYTVFAVACNDRANTARCSMSGSPPTPPARRCTRGNKAATGYSPIRTWCCAMAAATTAPRTAGTRSVSPRA